MNFFGWKRRSRKMLTVAITAVMSLTLLPAQGRSETLWQIVVSLSKPKQPQKPCCIQPECCPECCPQGVCTGACTMPCCPVGCGTCDAQVDKYLHLAKICTLLGHTEAANYFYYMAKKTAAKAKVKVKCECECECDGRTCWVNKPHRGCEGCGEECSASVQAAKLRYQCATQARTIEELQAALAELTNEVAALREDVDKLRKGHAVHHATTPQCIQPVHHWIVPAPVGLPYPTLTPRFIPNGSNLNMIPFQQSFSGIPYLPTWQVEPQAPASQPDRTQFFEFYIGTFR
jgi:uncharacterized coiled-coil protein SlyX